MNKLAVNQGLDWVMAVLCALAAVAVLQTFLIGQHFIIPTLFLILCVLTGNLAWFGFKGYKWAQYINFWSGVIFTSHCFFALFWAKKYREVLGEAFEPVAIIVTLFFLLLCFFYGQKNQLFQRTR